MTIKKSTEEKQPLQKPAWIRMQAPTTPAITSLKKMLRQHNICTVCEEALCPNITECFKNNTATFMIMGNKCTRCCTFCNITHGKPEPLDFNEPNKLAVIISKMNLRYVVITSVTRDDLLDGGAEHFANCIKTIRQHCANVKIEILVPDFRNKRDIAYNKLKMAPPDVFNHNLETIPRLYKTIRVGADYSQSLMLLKEFKINYPNIPTKSGLMLGLGETIAEIKTVLQDLRAHNCDMLTLGQYLQPSRLHSPVSRYVSPEEFRELGQYAKELGFINVASSPLVRSSYHAELQATDIITD